MECLICGKNFKRVCSHARQSHGVSAREYKEAFGLDVRKGILSSEDSKLMREYALANGMDEQLKKAGKATRFKKGTPGLGVYQRSAQTIERFKTTLTYTGKGLKRG
jgi:ROS/MUCR transcriptional regulator protein